jgi:hypothetical protein
MLVDTFILHMLSDLYIVFILLSILYVGLSYWASVGD